jgi:hypothetical protein
VESLLGQMAKRNPDPFEQLVWGITGERSFSF